MFNGAKSFNQSLDKWDMSSAYSVNDMFCNAISFNQSLDSWNVNSLEGIDTNAFQVLAMENNSPKWLLKFQNNFV